MRHVVVLFLAALLPAFAWGQPAPRKVLLPGETASLRLRLAAADRQVGPFAAAEEVGRLITSPPLGFPYTALTVIGRHTPSLEKYEQTLEEYLQLVSDAGDALVPAALGQASVQLRRLVHMRLAAWPAPALQLYRQRVDAQAAKLLQEGLEQRTAAPLKRLVDEFFCSTQAEAALDLLGELAFQRGHFEEALFWWELLGGSLDPSSADARLHYPHPQSDRAIIGGKQVLALAFAGRWHEADRALANLVQMYPNASGRLAGSTGPLAKTLATWRQRLTHGAALEFDAPWSTFGRNGTRNGVLACFPSPRLWVRGPTWRVRLPTGNEADELAPRTGPPSRLAYHPLVVGDLVLVADARSVIGYELLTGREKFRFDLKGAELETPAVFPEGRFTLTAWQGKVLARLGGQVIGLPREGDKIDVTPSYIVCLDVEDKPGRLLWHAQAQTPGKKPAFFEGTPLVDAGLAFVAVSRLSGYRVQTAVACLDVRTGKQRWWQEICDTPEFDEQAKPRQRQHLLTLGGGQLYYCSHSGAVAALDPITGKKLWALRYFAARPRVLDGDRAAGEVSPCVYAEGRLYVTPQDVDAVYCLDAYSGRVIWERDDLDSSQVLGVTRGRLLLLTARGIRALSAQDGSDRGGWVQPAEGKLAGLGRGLVAGGWILWPTQDAKLAYRGLTVDEGLQERFTTREIGPAGLPEPEFLEPTMLRALLAGNMAFGQGCLAVAGLDDLAVYVSEPPVAHGSGMPE